MLHVLQSVAELVETAAGPSSAILAKRSSGSHFVALTMPLADLRAAASRTGGTINDVYLAAVVGGLRHYHAKKGCFSPSLRLGIPINTRGAGYAGDLRNQFAPMLVRVPLQLVDASERIRLLHELIVAARNQPLLGPLEQAIGLLRRVPGSLRLVSALLGCTDLMASNVPGSPVDLYLAAAKVERVIPFGPKAGAAINLTLLSHVGAVDIGVHVDPAAVPDADVLIDCLRAGFDETLA
jgi:hypothetical protein